MVTKTIEHEASMRLLGMTLGLIVAGSATATTLETSKRPLLRVDGQLTVSVENIAETNRAETDFAAWLGGFKRQARAAGISQKTLQQAFEGVAYDARVIERDRNQSEFSKTIWDYLETAVSAIRIENGRAAIAENAETLAEIEKRFRVDAEVLVAIWGLESAYGAFRGSDDTIRSLATLAFDARRSDFFTGELLAALRILDAGDVSAEQMLGSWAGAMGHTQFMPTSYLAHAVDFDGDGRRDVWGDDPTDGLASAAAYLSSFGWTYGQPWGVEVTLPEGFDYTLANRDIRRSPQAWEAIGIRTLTGATLPTDAFGSILLPAGSRGPAFMIFDNFEVLEKYNTADAYVIAVGHLSDRLSGGGPVAQGWPKGDRALTRDERIELQKRLTAAGFDTVKVDGLIGPLTIGAVRRWQIATDRVPDGYANLDMLEALRLSN